MGTLTISHCEIDKVLLAIHVWGDKGIILKLLYVVKIGCGECVGVQSKSCTQLIAHVVLKSNFFSLFFLPFFRFSMVTADEHESPFILERFHCLNMKAPFPKIYLQCSHNVLIYNSARCFFS